MADLATWSFDPTHEGGRGASLGTFRECSFPFYLFVVRFVDIDMSCTCDKANMCTICAEINVAIVDADFDCFAGTNVAGVEDAM